VNDVEATARIWLGPDGVPLAAERRVDGTVELRALVDETGRVAEVSVVKALPRGAGFEEAALRHARSRLYRPGTKDGVAVRVWMSITVSFVSPKGSARSTESGPSE